MKKAVYSKVHSAIKDIWINDIKNDYENSFLLKEDTLKNAFYFHLRNRLGDSFLKENQLAIFTEYYIDTKQKIDLVVVKLDMEKAKKANVDDLVLNVKNPPPPLLAAKGDGSDDTVALKAIINLIPNESSYGTDAGKSGGILHFPIGKYGVSEELFFNQLGVVVRGVGIETSVIYALPNFVGDSVLRFKQKNNGYSNIGVGIENIGIYMNGIDAHGITLHKGYDGVTLVDVDVRDVADSKNGFRFIPDTDNPEKVTQTLNLQNLSAIHASKTATAPLFLFDTCQEINLIGCKAFGTRESNLQSNYSDAPLCYGFDFINSRGISMLGCSVAFTGLHAIRLFSKDRSSNGFMMSGCTFESVGGILKAEGTANGSVDSVRVVSYRKEGSINVGSQGLKGFELIRTRNAILETKDATVSLNSGCERNMIISEIPSNVNDSGGFTNLIGMANALSDYMYLGPGIKSPKADIGAFYKEGAEQMSLSHPWGAEQTGIFLNVNKNGTISKARVEVGAVDSGGTGYRMLRIPN